MINVFFEKNRVSCYIINNRVSADTYSKAIRIFRWFWVHSYFTLSVHWTTEIFPSLLNKWKIQIWTIQGVKLLLQNPKDLLVNFKGKTLTEDSNILRIVKKWNRKQITLICIVSLGFYKTIFLRPKYNKNSYILNVIIHPFIY